MTEAFHYEADEVDPDGRDLPGLKARFVVDHVPDVGVVVDVGCGGGKTMRTLARWRPQATLRGCDPQPLRRPAEGFEFTLVGPDGHLPYGDATADCALVLDVLEHVEAPAELLAEVARVVKPGGRLVAFVPAEGERWSWYAGFRRLFGADLFARTKDHIQAFSRDEVTELISQAFVIEERRYAYHALGALMDAAFSALLAVPAISRRFWTQSPYHAPPTDRPTWSARVLAGALRAANGVAWAESSLLARVPATSAGVLVVARRPA